ncbi:hypothetical protein Leryth_025044 [Lithospermum erythrorhizon]|nr:hypothetical protein Leryth_025044 [Lithospermum erythrorhizon]
MASMRPHILSSFIGDIRFIRPLHQLFRFYPGLESWFVPQFVFDMFFRIWANCKSISGIRGTCTGSVNVLEIGDLVSSEAFGRKPVSMELPKTFTGLTNLLFNRSSLDELSNTKRKRLKPGKVSPPRPVPDDIRRPPYIKSRKPPGISSGPEVHDEKGIERMRASGRLAAQVLQYAGTLVKPGITTDDIDQAVHQMIIDNGAYPSPLGYGGFPKSVCTSVNECICHGIPDSRALEEGDIVNIDVTVYLNVSIYV